MEPTLSSTESPQLLNTEDLAALIFDFDGTLVDSEPVWKSVFFDLFREHHEIEISDEVLWNNTGKGVDISVQNISDAYSLNYTNEHIVTMTDLLFAETHGRILDTLPLRDGALELFDWCNNNNIVMAICTASTDDTISSYLGKRNLLHYFAEIYSTAVSELDKRKPFPYPYLETMKALGVTAPQTLVIEDSPAGVTSARAAGITTIAIESPFLQAEVIEADPMVRLKDFHQVLELLVSS